MENRPEIWTATWWKFASNPNRVFFLTGFVDSIQNGKLVELYECGINEPVRPYPLKTKFEEWVNDKTILPHIKT